MLIDPGVIARLGAVITDPIEAGSGIFVKSPAFWTMVARRLRAVERALALSPIEAREMTARQRGSNYAIAVDVAAANAKGSRWYIVDFGQPGLRIKPQDTGRPAAEYAGGKPDGSVGWIWHNRVGP